MYQDREAMTVATAALWSEIEPIIRKYDLDVAFFAYVAPYLSVDGQRIELVGNYYQGDVWRLLPMLAQLYGAAQGHYQELLSERIQQARVLEK